ncbi:MAG: ParA family protein [Thermodesulfobacteriota bacterium]
MNSIFSIINHNDKSGKTIISFNLAVALSMFGKKSLYMADAGNDALSFITEAYTTEKKDDSGILSDLPCSLYQGFIPDFDVLAFDTEAFDPEEEKDRNLIIELKKYLKKKYDYIIADTKSSLAGDIDFFTFLADKYIIPLETDEEAFDSLVPLLAKLEWLKKDKIINSQSAGFLINKADKNSRLNKVFKKQSFYLFKTFVLDSVIPYSSMLDLEKNKYFSITNDIISMPAQGFFNFAELLIKQGENK